MLSKQNSFIMGASNVYYITYWKITCMSSQVANYCFSKPKMNLWETRGVNAMFPNNTSSKLNWVPIPSLSFLETSAYTFLTHQMIIKLSKYKVYMATRKTTESKNHDISLPASHIQLRRSWMLIPQRNTTLITSTQYQMQRHAAKQQG
jgi:hypothetical protein